MNLHVSPDDVRIVTPEDARARRARMGIVTVAEMQQSYIRALAKERADRVAKLEAERQAKIDAAARATARETARRARSRDYLKIASDASAKKTVGWATRARIDRIKRLVCFIHRVAVSDVDSPTRMVPIVNARQQAMWLVRKHVKSASYPLIGQKFGGRDHSTAVHAIQKCNALRAARGRPVCE